MTGNSGFCLDKGCLLKDPTVGFKGTQIQCFKYDTTNNPVTVLYCQWWLEPRLKHKDPIEGGNPKGFLMCQEGTDTNPNLQENQDHFLIDYGSINSKNNLKTVEAKSVLLGSCKPAYMLGLEIFSGRSVGTVPKQSFTTPDVLLANNPPTLTGTVGLYIVGARRLTLGTAPPTGFQNAPPLPQTSLSSKNQLSEAARNIQTKTNEVLEEITLPSISNRPIRTATSNASGFIGDTTNSTDDDNDHPIVSIVNKPESATTLKQDTNPNSIMLMLLWKDPASANTEYTLYSGGDAEWQSEHNLVYWISRGSKPVKVSKLGHHGSRAGTSPTLLKYLKPEHVVVSAGYLHGHPGRSGSMLRMAQTDGTLSSRASVLSRCLV